VAVLYRHIRLDKNEPFYVGIGKNEHRAYSKRSRNKHWHNIIKKGYIVEIMLYHLTWKEACEKEKEFISLYGRSDIGTGSLCNWTDGGEGSLNCKHSEESKQKISKSKKEKPTPLKSLEALEKYRKRGEDHHMKRELYKKMYSKMKQKQVEQYSKNGILLKTWESIMHASSALNIDNSSIGKACMGKLKTAGNYCWKIKIKK
jgi:hypothetical protein